MGFIDGKHIVSYLPDFDGRAQKKQKKSIVSGFVIEDEDEERAMPVTNRQMEHMQSVFVTNLLMFTSAFPQFKQFDLMLEDAESFYKWFHGPSIASRFPAPPVHERMRAERMTWREVARLMHMGKTMKESLM